MLNNQRISEKELFKLRMKIRNVVENDMEALSAEMEKSNVYPPEMWEIGKKNDMFRLSLPTGAVADSPRTRKYHHPLSNKLCEFQTQLFPRSPFQNHSRAAASTSPQSQVEGATIQRHISQSESIASYAARKNVSLVNLSIRHLCL